MIHVFLLTYNEELLWLHNYPKSFVDQHFKSNNIHFVVLDNGNQAGMKAWCEENNYTYYASEYNIGSSGGYNWIFKTALGMGLDAAVLMQADVEFNNAEPLILTYNLARTFGSRDFFIWPQHLYEFWKGPDSAKPWVNERLHNLGNIVGFNPNALDEKDCYFDENYVVTHFDDVEFLLYLDNNGKMSYKNMTELLNHSDHFYSESLGYPVPLENSFNIRGPNYHIKIHHASMKIDKANKGIENSHGPWYDFNRPYYDTVQKRKWQRLPYDPQRWQQFGYPAYPVHYEIERFFKQYPKLLKTDSKLWEIPNK